MPDRKPLPLQPSTISDRSAATITSLTNGAQNLHHPGARISVSPPSSSYPDLPDSHLRQLPRLPPELLLQVLSYYTNAAHSRDPTTIRTLQALSCTCKLLHFQALKVRYEVLLLHRHVRDFRTWFRKLNEGKPPFVCAGISRALFSGLDDVSRLTHASTGWETELLRLLHYCGQTVARLSLWHAESRTVLRDASQVPRKRPRLPNGRRSAIPRMQPGWAWGEGIDFTSEESSSSESPTPENGSENEDKSSDGGQSDIQRPKEGILNREGELDEVQKAKARAEASAARERAKAVPPRWLSSELSSDPLAAHRHRAHLPNEPLETAETSILPLRPPATTSNTTSNDPGDPQPGRRKGARRDNEADVGGGATSEDNRKLFGCSPLYVSICVGSALIEDRLWPRLRLLRRCREIDIFVPVTTYVPRVLTLISTLEKSPLQRIRISGPHASLILALPPFARREALTSSTFASSHDQADSGSRGQGSCRKPERQGKECSLNLSRGIRYLLSCPTLRQALQEEFTGNHQESVSKEALESELCRAVLAGHEVSQAASAGAHMRENGSERKGTSHFANGAWSAPTCCEIHRSAMYQLLRSFEPSQSSRPFPFSSTAVSSSGSGRSSIPDPICERSDDVTNPSFLDPRHNVQEPEKLRIKILQRNQSVWGKLAVRREIFLDSVNGGMQAWARCGVWDS